MAIPNSGELGGSSVTTAQFQTRIEALRDAVATLQSDLDVAESAIQSNDDDITAINTSLASKANTSGTYASLRAQATTKSDVGLSNVANYGVTTSVSSTSTTTYATASAVKTAYDLASSAQSNNKKVTLKASRTNIGIWTITGLTANVPLYVTVGAQTGSSYLSINVTDGTVAYQGRVQSGEFWLQRTWNDNAFSTPTTSILVPSGTSITFSVLGLTGTALVFQ